MEVGAEMAQGWGRAALEAQARPPGVDWLPAPSHTHSQDLDTGFISGCWEVRARSAKSAVSVADISQVPVYSTRY